MNMISDTKGRKISVLISVACMIIGATRNNNFILVTIIGGVYDIVAILMISQVISGFGGYATVSLSYILLADFCNDKYRQFGTIIVNSAW
jgi:MFS family permease